MTLDLTAPRARAEAAEARGEKATPGPWRVGHDEHENAATLDAPSVKGDSLLHADVEWRVIIPFGRAGSDSRFISHAREDVPVLAADSRALCDEVERLRRLCGQDHASNCAALFAAVPCDCGWHGDGNASSETLTIERDEARAEVERLRIAHQTQFEAAYLAQFERDAALAELAQVKGERDRVIAEVRAECDKGSYLGRNERLRAIDERGGRGEQ